MRFPLELIARVRRRIGADRLLGFRMNGHDLMPGGYDTKDYCRVAADLEAAGVDIIHVSAGTYRAMERRVTPMYLGEAPFADYAAEIKHAVNIPVIVAGSIHSVETAEALVADGRADYVAMARPIFADPDLPRKVIAGREAWILPCIRCNTCVSREQAGARSLCAINPATGYEGRWTAPPKSPRRVLIAGGGPAGLQAALTASRRGHAVTLVERRDALGGALGVAALLPFKSGLRRYLDRLSAAVQDAGVEIILGTDLADRPDLSALADDVVLAIGAEYRVPEDFGRPAIDPATAIEQIDAIGRSVVVIGADLAGAETAWHLATTDRQVTLVDPREGFGEDVNLISRLVVPAALQSAGALVRFGCTVTGAEDGGILIETASGREFLAAETVIVASGARPIAAPWAEALALIGKPVHAIGEAAGLFGLRWATHSGDATARTI